MKLSNALPAILFSVPVILIMALVAIRVFTGTLVPVALVVGTAMTVYFMVLWTEMGEA